MNFSPRRPTVVLTVHDERSEFALSSHWGVMAVVSISSTNRSDLLEDRHNTQDQVYALFLIREIFDAIGRFKESKGRSLFSGLT